MSRTSPLGGQNAVGALDALDRIDVGLVALDVEASYTYVNAAAASLLGVPREDMLGRHVWDVFPGGVGSAVHRAMDRAVETGSPATVEDYSQSRDRWHECRIHPHVDGLHISFTDITPRVHLERSLRDWARLVEQVGVGLAVLRADVRASSLQVLSVSSALAAILGIDEAALVGDEVTPDHVLTLGMRLDETCLEARRTGASIDLGERRWHGQSPGLRSPSAASAGIAPQPPGLRSASAASAGTEPHPPGLRSASAASAGIAPQPPGLRSASAASAGTEPQANGLRHLRVRVAPLNGWDVGIVVEDVTEHRIASDERLELAARLLRAAEDDRHAVGADVLGGCVDALVATSLRAATAASMTADPALRAELSAIEEEVRSGVAALLGTLAERYPPQLADGGLEAALPVLGGAAGVRVVPVTTGPPARGAVRDVAYRLVRDAVSAVESGAVLDVLLDGDSRGGLSLTVRTDCGRREGAIVSVESADWVRLLAGSVTEGAQLPDGTLLTAELPGAP